MAGEDPEYLTWIRSRPCCVGVGCRGPVEAHHKTGAGMSLRAHDHQAMPLCHRHHVEHFHGLTGYFKGWRKAELKVWQEHQIEVHRQDYERRGVRAEFPTIPDDTIPF